MHIPYYSLKYFLWVILPVQDTKIKSLWTCCPVQDPACECEQNKLIQAPTIEVPCTDIGDVVQTSDLSYLSIGPIVVNMDHWINNWTPRFPCALDARQCTPPPTRHASECPLSLGPVYMLAIEGSVSHVPCSQSPSFWGPVEHAAHGF